MRLVAATAAILAVLAIPTASSAGERKTLKRSYGTGLVRVNNHGPEWWRWRAVVAQRELKYARAELKRTHRTLAKSRRATRRALAGHFWTPLERSFLCIHAGEGSWTDTGAPYWGGLQMDESFQKTYGRPFYDYFGTADKWPVSVQLAVAIRAYMTRGFYPWPHTARRCGLL